jgi:hypothetical protein
VSNIFNNSFLSLLEPPLQLKFRPGLLAGQLSRAASFSLSGSTASGLLLFLWDGGLPPTD